MVTASQGQPEWVAAREAEILGKPPRLAPVDRASVATEIQAVTAKLREEVVGDAAPIPLDLIPEIMFTLCRYPDLWGAIIDLSLPLQNAKAVLPPHVRADPPMPLKELARLERSLAEISAIGRRLNHIAGAVRVGEGVDHGLCEELAPVLSAVEELRQALREVVRLNRISWESGDAKAS